MERRHGSRWQINRKIKIRLEGAKKDMACIIHDLNFNGARISLKKKLPQDRPLKITINLSEGAAFEAEAWVVWHKEVMDMNVYGIYFNRVKDSDKAVINNFMQRNAPGFLSRSRWQAVPEILEQERGKEEMLERRVFERIPVNLPVRLIDVDSNRELEATACDVSAKGLGIVGNVYLESGNRVELWLNMVDKNEPFYSRGTVVWSGPQETGEYRGGISLEKAEFMGLHRIFGR